MTRCHAARAAIALADQATARLELDAAIATFRQLDAQPDLERALRHRDATAPIRSAPSRAAPLSARELEVLGLVARGATNREVATALTISEHTVARHMANIRTKLGVASRAAATALAIERGWLRPT